MNDEASGSIDEGKQIDNMVKTTAKSEVATTKVENKQTKFIIKNLTKPFFIFQLQ